MCFDTPPADHEAVIRENAEMAPGYWAMRLAADVAFAPGQFFQLCLRPGEWGAPLLRRAFVPVRLERDGFTFVYGVVGTGTRLMTALPAGTRVRVLGPLGRGWRLPVGGGAFVIGGGAGAPGLLPLVTAMERGGVRTHVIVGARTRALLLDYDVLAAAASTCDAATIDGSAGYHGHAAAAAAAWLDAWRGPKPTVFACGPEPMLRAVAALAAARRLACQVSLEGRMACGFGACMGCATAVHDGDGIRYVRVCREGPVFDAAELAFPPTE